MPRIVNFPVMSDIDQELERMRQVIGHKEPLSAHKETVTDPDIKRSKIITTDTEVVKKRGREKKRDMMLALLLFVVIADILLHWFK